MPMGSTRTVAQVAKMALARQSDLIKLALFIGVALFFFEAQATSNRSLRSGVAVYDVTEYGAKGDGKLVVDEDGNPGNNIPFIKAWRKTCDSAGPAKMVIPAGNFVIGQILFGGPCKNPNPIIEFQGTVVACKDPSVYYSPEWFLVENVNGISMIGSGTFDGQGVINFSPIDCKHNPQCIHLAPSLKFDGAAKAGKGYVKVITAVNSHFRA
ncbi:hypothetical protein Droror1_Dr00003676 [Drosera rotundifolia]